MEGSNAHERKAKPSSGPGKTMWVRFMLEKHITAKDLRQPHPTHCVTLMKIRVHSDDFRKGTMMVTTDRDQNGSTAEYSTPFVIVAIPALWILK